MFALCMLYRSYALRLVLLLYLNSKLCPVTLVYIYAMLGSDTLSMHKFWFWNRICSLNPCIYGMCKKAWGCSLMQAVHMVFILSSKK